MNTTLRTLAERNLLVLRNRGLAGTVTRRMRSYLLVNHVTTDEGYSEALLGLIDAAERWDPARGHFVRFACWCMKRRLIHHVRHCGSLERKRLRRLLTLDERALWRSCCSGDDPRRPAEDREKYAALHAALATLKPGPQKLLREHYLKGRSLTEMAAELGTSKSWLSRKTTAAARTLRLAMARRGYDAADCRG